MSQTRPSPPDDWTARCEANVDVVQRAIEAINAGDAEGLLALFADDIHFRMAGRTPFSGELRGKDAFLELFGRVMERLDGPIVLQVRNLIPAGEWVVAETVGDARTKQGRPYRNGYCMLWRLEDGRVTHLTEYNDTQLIMEVLLAE